MTPAQRRLTLRTRAALVAGFLGVFVMGASVAYNIQRIAENDLTENLSRQVALLANLPPLQEALRRADHQTMRYLLTGNPAWRAASEEGDEQARAELADLLEAAAGTASFQESLVAVKTAVEAALSEQREMVKEVAQGRASHARAVQLASEARATDLAVRRIATLRELNYEGLVDLVEESHRASRGVLATIVATGFAAVFLLLYALTVFVVRPIEQLDLWARGWSPDRDLGEPPLEAGSEVEGLCRSVAEMARRARAQVRQESEFAQVKSSLVSTLSHEFNNALSVVHGVAVLLEETEGTGTPEERACYYAMIDSNLKSITTEMRTLIEMGRLEGGAFAVRPRRMEGRAVLLESLERLRVLAERRKQTVATEFPDVPVVLRGDPEALSLVATNLVSNAIKYTPDGGTIRLRIEATQRGGRLSVSDTGIGIADADKEKVFGGYYRTEAGRLKAKGFGVGLTLARHIVEAHGEKLSLVSEVGKGSTFSFELPLWKEERGSNG
ncbi:MAG: hypothetical protein HY928_06345 [Elusimicrobia bacterium]|nr:hypothetical protein [Elusimicrobiota bacterium]